MAAGGELRRLRPLRMPREVHFVRASPLDVIVIAVYLVGITLFGIRVGYRREASTDQYFLAGKSLGWFTVGAAVFTSTISWGSRPAARRMAW
jgi:hypothetical protein